jgi:hypothetical protein
MAKMMADGTRKLGGNWSSPKWLPVRIEEELASWYVEMVYLAKQKLMTSKFDVAFVILPCVMMGKTWTDFMTNESNASIDCCLPATRIKGIGRARFMDF